MVEPAADTAPSSRAGGVVDLRASIEFGAGTPALLGLKVTPRSRPGQRVERCELSIGGAPLPVPVDQPLVRAATDGSATTVDVSAVVHLEDQPDAGPLGFEDLVAWLVPSRYCPSDALVGFAGKQFGGSEPAAIDAVIDFVRSRTSYDANYSYFTTTAIDTLTSAAGVCRDFAHLSIALLRALEIPARYVAVYGPGLEPQDFHALVEAHDGERWRLLDATGLSDPTHAVRICTGRDGADAAFLTMLFGTAPLVDVTVHAELR